MRLIGTTAVVLAAFALAGCPATKKSGPGAKTAPATTRAKGAGQPQRVRLAVMRIEDEIFSDLASAITRELAVARVVGFDEVFVPAPSLEVVQIQIECIDATPACWRAAGRSVGATQMVLTGFASEAADKPKKSQRKKPLTVTLTVFDIVKGTPVRAVSRRYKNEKDAVKNIADLVSEMATGGASAEAKP